MNVWTIVARLCPMVIVPGMMRSFTIFRILYQAVVGAYDPMPSVSKKFVTNPPNSCSAFGNRVSVAGVRVPPAFAALYMALPQIVAKPALIVARAANRIFIGSIAKRFLSVRDNGGNTIIGLLATNKGKKSPGWCVQKAEGQGLGAG